METYYWKKNIYKVDPQDVGEYLKRIESETGGIEPSQLVEYAKESTNILHDVFTWDDTKAAGKWRVEQAKDLLRSIKVSIIDLEIENVRAFVNTVDDDGRSYKSISTVIRNPDEWKYVMDEAKREMEYFIGKYKKFKEVAKIIKTMEDVLIDAP